MCVFLQLMQDLTQPRPLEADRREFFCQVEAFAGLVVLNVVPLAGAAPPLAFVCSKGLLLHLGALFCSFRAPQGSFRFVFTATGYPEQGMSVKSL